MTNHRRTLLLATLSLLPLAGCVHTAITGEKSHQERIIHGTVGITGEKHQLTLLAGSDVQKLSIIGEDNRVVVQDGATVRKVEIVGENNEVICPADMPAEYSEIGEHNRIKHEP
jgi:hypothetical protein